ncbi:hypothetical protein [Mycobacterium sp. 852002-51961_SCH5331710]|uniref:hypothetical protein n=1 Tax=Mycobacterium sp. 852002-51961_SCH5331710 TaxID=1834105 RepID=UPI0007FE4FB2|nr:hypothetical protein [Mycobacterium sp. 852002-51961_SCH5331710]OBB48415.1 hypothetical protein A5752_21365 [Mycobacterium sp. 852002-51961_SCH5331710]
MTDHPHYPGPDDYPDWDTSTPRVHVTAGTHTAVLRALAAFTAEDEDFAAELADLAAHCASTDKWLEAVLALMDAWRMYVLAGSPRDVTVARLRRDQAAATTAMLVNGPESLVES